MSWFFIFESKRRASAAVYVHMVIRITIKKWTTVNDWHNASRGSWNDFSSLGQHEMYLKKVRGHVLEQ
jgi:hypothetical protein